MFKKQNVIHFISFLLFVVVIAACADDSITEKKDGSKEFTYEPLSWKIDVPVGWEVSSETERRHMAYKAATYYENSEADDSKKEIIFAAKKGDSSVNSIYAFVREYPADEAEGPDMRALLRQQYAAYSSAPYNAEQHLTDMNIGKYIFTRAMLDIYYNNQPYYIYTTYSTMIDTLNFGVTIIGDNEADRKMLTENFYKSVLTIKK